MRPLAGSSSLCPRKPPSSSPERPAPSTSTCPKCQAPYERDFNEQYLSYPQANAPTEVTLYCGSCEHEWEVTMRLNITLELVSP